MSNFFVTGQQGANSVANVEQPQSQVFTALVPALVRAGDSGGSCVGHNNTSLVSGSEDNSSKNIVEKHFNMDLQAGIRQAGLNPGSGTISLLLGPRREASEVPKVDESSVMHHPLKSKFL